MAHTDTNKVIFIIIRTYKTNNEMILQNCLLKGLYNQFQLANEAQPYTTSRREAKKTKNAIGRRK